jgi:mannose-6-phosphate isomerase-like protein (cupin superfamily)
LWPGTVAVMDSFDVAGTVTRLSERGGGYEVVHTSPGLEIGVYVLVPPDIKHQVPHVFDEAYVVLDGEGEFEVEGERRPVMRGEGIFVPAGVDHQFHAYEELALLVVFNGPQSAALSE